ncbi:MAG TPA: alpha/beta hydrolase [Xanthobacteraceae bacterium]|nr:alpha/beta hydrolase [Xanthobacteraceae bacterium]
MATIDYEAEYNNRVRVPEHPEIFTRWTAEGEAYRAETLKGGRAQLGLSYGDTPRQTLDLFFPAAGEAAPLALFIHGGWWRSLDGSMFSQMACGPNAGGIAVAVVTYDLCPNVAIADIIEQIRRAVVFLWQRLNKRMFVYGHSAGGQLSAAMVATDWASLYPKAPADLIASGFAVSGVFDLAPLVGISINQDLKLTAESARTVSPLFWPVKSGRVFDAFSGGLESSEFKRQSQTVAETWRAKGAVTRSGEIPGANHFTAIDPFADPKSDMTARVVELASQIRM